ncbi:MAG TPA: phenylalanine--tRNA ligase subunit beta [Patescibacteria group bacterium]|nr:phenylalanine--tRNA ligase subunit beta [Patescibacteria group bacterium]
MKFTLSWLKEYLDTTASLDEISHKLTAIGLEVEGIDDPAKTLDGFVVAHVVSAEKHPDADKLQCLVVDTGREQLKVVCGAPNARAGMKGVFAPSGSFIPGSNITLKKSMIRGQESNGMMCSERELLLSDEHKGIIELPDDAKVGSPAAPALGKDDPVIEINLTPNRGDCAGILGIARDLAAAGLGTLKMPDASTVAGKFKNPITVETKDSHACPHFIGRYIKGVKNGPSPKWLQDRLKSIGLRPISALVDITNYMTIACGRPLHVFDADKLKGNITVRLSKAGETLAALNDKSFTLEDGMTVVCDDSGVLGLGGIIGGTSTAVSDATTNVYLEAAYFDPVRTAKTGQKLQIDSDARYRFERGIDPGFTAAGAEIATKLIQQVCGGEASEVAVAGSAINASRPITYAPERLKLLGGMELADDRQKHILTTLGFTVKDNGKTWDVLTPSWRGDVEGAADIVEEVLRIEGYDNIPTVYVRPLADERRSALSPLAKRAATARRLLAMRGLYETVTWSFMDDATSDLFGAQHHQNKAALTLTNPISSDLAVMRPSILPNLVAAAGRNADRGFPDACLFEIGTVFKSTEAAGQLMTATGLRTGSAVARHWAQAPRDVDVYDAKSDALAVLENCGVNPASVQISADAPEWYHPGRSGTLRQGPTVLAYFGELHPAVLMQMKRDEKCAGFEVFLANIPAPKKKGARKELLKPSPFQPLHRDFAFVLDDKVEAEKLVKAIKGADKTLISHVEIFDVYTGKGVDPGKKSVAIGVTLQPVEKTLTDEEITAVSQKIVEAVVKQTGGSLRS